MHLPFLKRFIHKEMNDMYTLKTITWKKRFECHFIHANRCQYEVQNHY